MLWWFRFRLWLRDLLRPTVARWFDLDLPGEDGKRPDQPEVGRNTFDTLHFMEGSYSNRYKFAEGIEPFDVMAAVLLGSSIWCLKQENPVNLLHLTYNVRVRWQIDLEPIDPAAAKDVPVWDGGLTRHLVAKMRGEEVPKGDVLPFRPR